MRAAMSVSTSEPGDGTIAVLVCGEIDAAGARLLRQAVRQALSAAPARVVTVDLGAVTSLSREGIGVLVAGHRRARATRTRFRLINPSGTAELRLRQCGLAETFGLNQPA
jgi:anti-anti-sigma factor